MDEAIVDRAMKAAMKMVSENGSMSPVMLLKISGRDDMICTNPDMSTPETKANTVDLIKMMIASGSLLGFVLACEASRRQEGVEGSTDCILVMVSDRSSEKLHICDIIRGDEISFGEWSVCSDSSPLRQGALNNLFDRVLCSNN